MNSAKSSYTPCDSVVQRCSPGNLLEDTINKRTQMILADIYTITIAAYEPVDPGHEFTLSELEVVLYHLKDTAPRDDTVCYSIIKNAPLATRNFFLRLINQPFTEWRLPTKWKMTNIIPIPIKDKRIVPSSHYFLSKVMERLVLTKVKWSAQPINQYSLSFRGRVGAVNAIVT